MIKLTLKKKKKKVRLCMEDKIIALWAEFLAY